MRSLCSDACSRWQRAAASSPSPSVTSQTRSVTRPRHAIRRIHASWSMKRQVPAPPLPPSPARAGGRSSMSDGQTSTCVAPAASADARSNRSKCRSTHRFLCIFTTTSRNARTYSAADMRPSSSPAAAARAAGSRARGGWRWHWRCDGEEADRWTDRESTGGAASWKPKQTVFGFMPPRPETRTRWATPSRTERARVSSTNAFTWGTRTGAHGHTWANTRSHTGAHTRTGAHGHARADTRSHTGAHTHVAGEGQLDERLHLGGHRHGHARADTRSHTGAHTRTVTPECIHMHAAYEGQLDERTVTYRRIHGSLSLRKIYVQVIFASTGYCNGPNS